MQFMTYSCSYLPDAAAPPGSGGCWRGPAHSKRLVAGLHSARSVTSRQAGRQQHAGQTAKQQMRCPLWHEWTPPPSHTRGRLAQKDGQAQPITLTTAAYGVGASWVAFCQDPVAFDERVQVASSGAHGRQQTCTAQHSTAWHGSIAQQELML